MVLRRSASIDSLLDASATQCSSSMDGLDPEAALQATPVAGQTSRSGPLPNSPSVPSRLAKGVPGENSSLLALRTLLALGNVLFRKK